MAAISLSGRLSKHRIERTLGIAFGHYRVPRGDRRGPWGLVFFAPMGPLATPAMPRGFRPWLRAWRGANGVEITLAGWSVYAMAYK